ncbi:hypothetical protein OUZ56_029951 [Daphnia magna]|uniref:Uncharacterized protein n=1 Tax=Daphnia magna TaxID=35525 RepID=A0ABR0B8A1_9CRUS|nr:hypothetical protein OUZ56_029951 [Daphnia magna]
MDVGNFYKKETSLKEATSLETFLDSVSISRRYMVGRATHLKTTVYHASKEISTEADFQDIFKLQHYPYDLKPTVMQVHVLVDFSVSSWDRFLPTEYRQYYHGLPGEVPKRRIPFVSQNNQGT